MPGCFAPARTQNLLRLGANMVIRLNALHAFSIVWRDVDVFQPPVKLIRRVKLEYVVLLYTFIGDSAPKESVS